MTVCKTCPMPMFRINKRVNKLLISLYALMVLGLLGSLGVAVHQNWLLKAESTKTELARQAGIGNFIVENAIIHATKSLTAGQKNMNAVLNGGPLSARQAHDILHSTLDELSAYSNTSYGGLLLFLNEQGQLLARTDQEKSERLDFSDRFYFQRLKQQPELGLTLSPLRKAATTGAWVFHVAVPIRDKTGRFRGVLAQQIQIADIAQELNKYLNNGHASQLVTQSADTGLSFVYPLHLLARTAPEAIETPYADYARRSTSPQDTFNWPVSTDSKDPQALVGYAQTRQSNLLTTIALPVADVWWSFLLENLSLIVVAGIALFLITALFMHLYRISSRLSEALHDAFFDALTQIPNRRAFDDMFPRLLREAMRSQKPLSVLFIDIDHFKRFNDDYGHDGGDIALRAVAQTLRLCATRPLDFVSRWGGEEFIILLPHTNEEAAILIAEKVLAAVRQIQLHNCGAPMRNVSVSVGIACGVVNSRPLGEQLVPQADVAMKQAKQAGRDRYVVYSNACA